MRFLIVLVIPVLIAGLPLATRGRAWQPLSIVSAVLLMGWVFVGMLSIGWFFLPAAIAAIIGACLSRHPRALPPASAA